MDDEPIPELGNLAPASYAAMPALAFMRAHGEVSCKQTIPSGFEPSTEIALMNILGLHIEPSLKIRSWLEALGGGIDVKDNDLCIRCNLIAHNNVNIVSHCGFNPCYKESNVIIDLLNQHFASDDFRFYCYGNYRNLLIIRNCRSSIVARTPHSLVGHSVNLLNVDSDCHNLAKRLNHCIAEARKILKGHKANGIALWAPGHVVKFDAYIPGSVVAGVNVVKGIGRAIGMNIIDVPNATGDEFTDYEAKLEATIDALKKDDFVLLHIEAPDEISHQRNWKKKIKTLEEIDRLILHPLLTRRGNCR